MKPLKVSLTPMVFQNSVRIFRDKYGNDQILREGLPCVPRMKRVFSSFTPVVNIAFQRTPKGIILSCEMQCCKFKTYNAEKFGEHLKGHEATASVSGKCSICQIGFKANSLL